MHCIDFPESNKTIEPPPGVSREECIPVRAHLGQLDHGAFDGHTVIVVAWKPTMAELQEIMDGKPIFITFISPILVPHLLSTDFKVASQLR